MSSERGKNFCSWKYGLLEFYHDIFFTILVACVPCVVEAQLVAKHSEDSSAGKKMGAAVFLMFMLPIAMS